VAWGGGFLAAQRKSRMETKATTTPAGTIQMRAVQGLAGGAMRLKT
jgi:hypothetical protein